MDIQIVRDIFSGILELADVVNEADVEFLDKTRAYLDNLPPMQIGKHGNIMEWLEDYEEAEPGHRHISHLYGLYPSNQITPSYPELFEAAKKTIERRLKYGGGHTGWSKAWIVNMYNRLFDRENARIHLEELIKKCTLPNLFDSHPPFQIDGNFGGCNAIAGMLMYDSGEEIRFLPALPENWKNGSFRGFCAKGRKKVSCTWRDGKVVESNIEII
jgi:alpha-L-fucosidase 2